MIHLKTDYEIDIMKRSGRLAAELLDMIEAFVKPGVTTLELNDICEEFTAKHRAVSAPLNYRGFPRSICTSINEVVCHGIPSAETHLKEGDIINIDVTPVVDGYHGDASRTYFCGHCAEDVKKLVHVTKDCLDAGIGAVRAGGRVGDIGSVIEKLAQSHGFSVVRDFVGHGIGRNFHEAPDIYHYGEVGQGVRLMPGMVFTIEPMINQGNHRTLIKQDGWTAVTWDGSLSAQFEHTVAIRSNGKVEILTVVD